MLDYPSIIGAALGVIGLAAMIIVFLKRRAKTASVERTSKDQEKAAAFQKTTGETDRSEPQPESTELHSEHEIEKAKEELRALNLQRQITTSAMTTVFEAEAQGKISRPDRDKLIEEYKAELKALDEQIAERKKITELSDLLSERQELVKSFEQKLAEIDERLRHLNAQSDLISSIPPLGNPTQDTAKIVNPTTALGGSNGVEESKPKEKARSRAEERIDAIREEVLKALERLEQIESEG